MLEPRKLDTTKLPEAVLAKWSPVLLDEGFVPFPKRLLRCLCSVLKSEQGMEELAVLLAIADYKRPNLLRPPSAEYLAFTAGLDQKRFKEVLINLEKRKWITADGNDSALNVDFQGFMNEVAHLTSDSSESSARR